MNLRRRRETIKVQINDDESGTPLSCVAHIDIERLIGDAAKNQIECINIVFDAKRMIGRRFSDPTIQNDMKHWSFKVYDDGHDKPIIEVQYKGETKRFTPEEISSMVLTKMKRQQSHLLERQYPMQLLHVQHISTIHKDKPQRMQVQLPD